VSRLKRRNRISGQWSARLIEMLESPAYRALSLSAHRVISRIEIELGHHGGNDNGRLPVTFEDFTDYGIHHNAIAPAIREAEALGFIRIMERGRGGNAEHRQPNKFFLTFAHGRDSRASPPTHDWRKIESLEEAIEIAQAARHSKNPRAVQFAERRNRKTKNRYRKPVVAPHPEIGSETAKSPHPETGSTASPPKPVRLSISPVGERSGATEASLQPDLGPDECKLIPLVWTTPVVTEVMDQFAAAAIRTALTPTVSPHLRQAIVQRGWAMPQNTKETA
jgi:hypothetical protein